MATKGEQSKEKILAQATRVFNRQGFRSTTINDLLEATGTTKGNLYFHFSGKDEVGLEVLKRETAAFMPFLDAALSGDTPGAGLDNFLRCALLKHRRSGFVGGCLFGNTALEASDTAPVFAELVAGVFAEWIGKIESIIAEAQQAGQVRRDLPARDLAELVVATVEGGIMQARLQKVEGPMSRALATLRVLLDLKV
jgi:TetR/AcrR family transcriptional repressor of nem operon